MRSVVEARSLYCVTAVLPMHHDEQRDECRYFAVAMRERRQRKEKGRGKEEKGGQEAKRARRCAPARVPLTWPGHRGRQGRQGKKNTGG